MGLIVFPRNENAAHSERVGWEKTARSRNQSDPGICRILPAHKLRIIFFFWNFFIYLPLFNTIYNTHILQEIPTLTK